MKNEFIESGRFVGTHGVRGTLRVQPWCDTPSFLCQFKRIFIKQNSEYETVKIVFSKVHGNVVLLDIEGVNSIEEADKLKNKIVYISRKDFKLEEGQYLICDLVGCKVFENGTNKPLGEISDVSKTGANDVWHIKSRGKEYLIPVIPSVVNSVDIDEEKIIITPIAGIFDDMEVVEENSNAD